MPKYYALSILIRLRKHDQMRLHRMGERFKVVSAFKTGDDPSLTMTVRDLFQNTAHPGIALFRQPHAGQRIIPVRIKTG